MAADPTTKIMNTITNIPIGHRQLGRHARDSDARWCGLPACGGGFCQQTSIDTASKPLLR